MTERGRFEATENTANYTATNEVAAQAWDKAQFRGQVCSRGDQDVMCVDFTNDDIYNRNAGNHNLRDANQSLQMAENSIESVLRRLEGGNVRGAGGLIKQLDRSSDALDRGADSIKDGIRNLASESDVEDLIDLAGSRRDAKTADRYVDRAIKALEQGHTRAAAHFLRESLEEIDEAQSGIKDGTDSNDRSRDGRRGDLHDWREPDNDRRMQNHMYIGRGLNPLDPRGVQEFVSNQTGIDLRQLTRAGDQVSRIVDPIGAFPRPGELTDPGKFLSRLAKGPFGLFG